MSNRSHNYLLITVKKILRNGIYLGALTKPHEYLSDIANFFNERGFCRAIHVKDEVIIEADDWTPIMSLTIEKNTLIMTPLMDANFFQCFMDTLEYVTKVGVKKSYDQKEPEVNKETKKDDKNDDPDFEWI